MLGKMLLHGAVAAALIGSAAAVYAQTKDDGKVATVSVQSARPDGKATAVADGYLHPAAEGQAAKTAHGYLHPSSSGRSDEKNGRANVLPRHDHDGGKHHHDDDDD